MSKLYPPVDELLKHVRYDPERGEIIRNRTFNRYYKKGDVMGTVVGNCISVSAMDHSYTVGQLGWYLAYGKPPKGKIAHKDRNPFNNRLSNLVDVSESELARNYRPKRMLGASGVRGVHVRRTPKGTVRYQASISLNNRSIHIGSFDTLDEAIAAREAKHEELSSETERHHS